MSPTSHPRRAHRFPICERTGKRRLREHKDVHLTLQRMRVTRAHAELAGTDIRRREVRGYPCGHCGGWHLTSWPTSDQPPSTS